jgi:hypothetical protein
MSVNAFVCLNKASILVSTLTDCWIEGTSKVVQTNRVQDISPSEVAFCFRTSTVFVDQVFGLCGIDHCFIGWSP